MSDESIRERFERQSLLVQVVVVVLMVLGPLATAAGAGWAAKSLIGKQATLVPRVNTLEDSVYREDVNTRLDQVESEVNMLQSDQRETRRDLRAMQNSLDRILEGMDRIECLIQNPESVCLQRGDDSTGE